MAEEKKTQTRGRKPSTAKVDKEESKTVDIQSELNKANAEKNAMADMLKQMQEQMAMLQAQLNGAQPNNPSVVIQQNDNLTRTVTVINMLPYTLNLSTQPYGKGRTFTFDNYGDKKQIRFADMQEIITSGNYLDRFEKGYAILTNGKDYEDLGIGYIAESVMSEDTMERLVSLSTDEDIDTILSMEEDMQEVVGRIVANKIAEGVSYDYNRIKELEDEGIEINEIVEMLKASAETK